MTDGTALIQHLADKLGVDVGQLDKNTRISHLFLDSLELMESVLELEQTYHIRLDAEKLSACKNLGEVMEYLLPLMAPEQAVLP